MITLSALVTAILGVLSLTSRFCERRQHDPVPVAIVVGVLWFLALAAGLPYVIR